LERDIQSYKAEKVELENALDVDNAELSTLAEQLEAQKDRLSKKSEKVAQAKNELQQRSKKVESTIKAITEKETEAQRASAGRFALLRRCKLEQIKIPLVDGSKSLDSLPVDNILQPDPDAMDVDEGDPPEAGMMDYGIEVDFEELDDDLKEASCVT
jgi:structural maintenance of chromosome 1